MEQCKHNIYLQRHRRTFWQKLIGIKEVYVCSRCGYMLRVK
ncbi:hypothetical protein B6K85_16065 [Vibrio sp. V1B]|nr:hypothetical protein B6K85_16065 [Vibrio sp. V1B]